MEERDDICPLPIAVSEATPLSATAEMRADKIGRKVFMILKL